jgi:hypothetical protein
MTWSAGNTNSIASGIVLQGPQRRQSNRWRGVAAGGFQNNSHR